MTLFRRGGRCYGAVNRAPSANCNTGAGQPAAPVPARGLPDLKVALGGGPPAETRVAFDHEGGRKPRWVVHGRMVTDSSRNVAVRHIPHFKKPSSRGRKRESARFGSFLNWFGPSDEAQESCPPGLTQFPWKIADITTAISAFTINTL